MASRNGLRQSAEVATVTVRQRLTAIWSSVWDEEVTSSVPKQPGDVSFGGRTLRAISAYACLNPTSVGYVWSTLPAKSREGYALGMTKELFIAAFYAERDAWGAVRSRCEYMLRRYPDTERVPRGLALLGRAMHSWGHVSEATGVRDRLASEHPGARDLKKLDRWLSRAPGEPPDEKVFVRPYRIRGISPLGGGAYRQ